MKTATEYRAMAEECFKWALALISGGMKLGSRGIGDIAELDNALTAMKQNGSTVLIVQPSPISYGQRGRIIASAMKNGLGTIHAFPIAAREGSLIAYCPDYLLMYRRAPLDVDRILKGTPRRLGLRCHCLC
jgi:ABC-type uncharacterized transport system substrate-binding protein